MPPLPFNLGIDTLLRRRVVAALFVAPLLLALASFVPFVLLDNLIKAEAGMPLLADMSERPNAAMLNPLSSVAFVLFPLAGYLLGWIVNAAALALAGWPARRVRSTILRSQVPESWLLRRKRSTDELARLAEEFRQWSTLREVGIRTTCSEREP